jgi:iron-regulated transporter 1
MMLTLSSKILFSRFLTRSGDQAWDFAVPLVLLYLFPGQLKFAALYYFVIRLAGVAILPHLAARIDRVSRRSTARLGIVLQLVGVIIGAVAVWFAAGKGASPGSLIGAPETLFFLALTFGGILSGLGASFMDISIANDLIPATFEKEALTQINAKLRRIDLLTEVLAPVAAGVLMSYQPASMPLLGFYLVASWNVLSFFPEYSFLNSVFNSRPDLQRKKIETPLVAKKTIFRSLLDGWRDFLQEPVALAVVAYAVLWLSALSPHGVLLTGFLKDEWLLPEWAIGIFRGLGALFGLAATVIYPHAVNRLGLEKGSRMFIRLQAVLIVIALGFFQLGEAFGKVGFLAAILFSRIALYGFSLGEMQIRQIWIAPGKRGEVNGFANSVTGIATLGLYGAGALLPSTADFKYLVFSSAGAVIVGAVIFSAWTRLRIIRP